MLAFFDSHDYHLPMTESIPAANGRRNFQKSNNELNSTLTALDTLRFFEERRQRADMDRFRQILTRPGGEPPQPGDGLPDPA